jgi:hypothetical protein
MEFSLFDQIYVINLLRCTDRREHIIKEFESVDIENYIFIPATDADSIIVHNILQNRGKQTLSNASIRNWSYLNKYQIANWCSYIRVWEDIIENNYELCLICEDDIKFTDYYKPVVEKVFNMDFLLEKGIDPLYPLVIGVGSGYQPLVHCASDNIDLITKNPIGNRDCNPCHIINGSMAKELLRNATHINRATDPYIHKQIGGLYQRYWVTPQPVYELSWNPLVRKFPSTIEGKLTANDIL